MGGEGGAEGGGQGLRPDENRDSVSRVSLLAGSLVTGKRGSGQMEPWLQSQSRLWYSNW